MDMVEEIPNWFTSKEEFWLNHKLPVEGKWLENWDLKCRSSVNIIIDLLITYVLIWNWSAQQIMRYLYGHVWELVVDITLQNLYRF